MLLLIFLIVTVCSAVVLLKLGSDALRTRGRALGFTLAPVNCPRCGTKVPYIRKPATTRQALYGGWTCRSCGSELDRHGTALNAEDSPEKSKEKGPVAYYVDGKTPVERLFADENSSNEQIHL